MTETTTDPLGARERWREEIAESRRLLVERLAESAKALGPPRVVIGLSGGLDSAVAAALCTEALGPENVLGILMPFRTTNPTSISLAQGIVNRLGITSRRVNMSPVVDAYFANFPDASRQRRGLCLSWQRICVLLDLGHHYGASVVQAVNRTDRVLRYGEANWELTDALRPLAETYKTQVGLLEGEIGLLAEVRQRKPSLEYWAGQTDESELGHSYDEIDPLLYGLIDRGLRPEELTAQGFSTAAVEWAEERVRVWRGLEAAGIGSPPGGSG